MSTEGVCKAFISYVECIVVGWKVVVWRRRKKQTRIKGHQPTEGNK
jgi:hypothetical protein